MIKLVQRCGVALEVCESILDARRFVKKVSSSPISYSTPHIYISALPLWHKGATISVQHWVQATEPTQMNKGVRESGAATHGLSGAFITACNGHDRPIASVFFSPDSTRIVSSSLGNTYRVWNLQNGSPMAEGKSPGHSDWPQMLASSQDGTRIVSISGNHTICVWDPHGGDIMAGPFKGHTGQVLSANFSSDDTQIVTGSYDCTIRIWDARLGSTIVGPLEGHNGVVSSVTFSPDNTCVASGSWDSTIRIWNAQSYSASDAARVFRGHDAPVSSVKFSPDGTRIVSNSHDGTIYVWDVYGSIMVASQFKGLQVSSVAFSSGDIYIASASKDHKISVWDVRTKRLIAKPLEGHLQAVDSLSFSPDGNLIVSGSRDRTIRVWDVKRMISAGLNPFENWNLKQDGWIVGPGGQLLLWVPENLRFALGGLQNPLVICPPDTPQIDSHALSLSDRWRDQFVGGWEGYQIIPASPRSDLSSSEGEEGPDRSDWHGGVSVQPAIWISTAESRRHLQDLSKKNHC
jgi:hypothetical protein